jgi:hypothetical protein
MIPNYLEDVKAAKAKYPEAWSHAHVTGDPKRWDFIRLLAADLHAKDLNVGLNGKRGNPNDLSMDALNYLCDADDSAGRTPDGTPCAVIDVIGSAGIPSQYPAWTPYTTQVEGSGAWVRPGSGTVPIPVPPTPTYPSYEALGGDEGGKKITRQLEADYKRAGHAGLDGDCGAWQQRVSYDFLTGICKTVEESIAKHRKEWCDALGIPVQ